MPKPQDTQIVATVLDLLARIEETLAETKEQTPAALIAVGKELVAAMEAQTTRIEAALGALSARVDEGNARVAARVAETTARVLEHKDVSMGLYRTLAQQIELLEMSRVNTKDAIQRIDREVETLQMEIDPKGAKKPAR